MDAKLQKSKQAKQAASKQKNLKVSSKKVADQERKKSALMTAQLKKQQKAVPMKKEEVLKSSRKAMNSKSKDDTLKQVKENVNENIDPKRTKETQQNRREMLEKWREEKGKNKLDTTNPLLSRKRPLAGFESYAKLIKKPKTVAAKNELHSDQKINNQQDKQREEVEKSETNQNEKVAENSENDNRANNASQERIASFSHVSPKPNRRTPRQQTRKTPSAKVENLNSSHISRQARTPRDRKTISFTNSKSVIHSAPSRRSTSTMESSNMQISPRRSKMATLPEDSVLRSAPSRRSISTIKVRKMQLTPFKAATPYRSKMSSLPENSVFRSAPSRRSISTIKVRNMVLTPFKAGTPHRSKMSSLPENSVLRSAPSSRRSVAASKKFQCNTPTDNAAAMTRKAVSAKTRRHTIHFTEGQSIPPGIAPFMPRGEWQNKNLTMRERLDIWLSVRGRTVKKPYVVLCRTPTRKRTVSDQESRGTEVDLNTTFTFEEELSDQEEAPREQVPNMNAVEKTVIEDSLLQMLARIEEGAEIETLKDELDLILSTSPGVVKLSLYWVAKARLATNSDSTERVICLLEQANAFGAEPQEMIRDEICLYLERLRKEVVAKEDDSEDHFAGNLPQGRTPSKRVRFMDTQRHLAFNSSLIKFCLLECTPFRKRMKSKFAKHVLTPVRRSGRIDKVESKLPSALRSHVHTVSSPSQLGEDVQNGEVYCLPNLNVDSKWNAIWTDDKKEPVEEKHNLSF